MMRRLLLLGASVAVLAVVPGGVATAKGSTLHFERELYTAGATAVASAKVHVWPGSSQPEDGPYTVYLVRGEQPLWYGHLPNKAIRVGELDTRGLTPTRTVRDEAYEVSLRFEVPQVQEGLYQVWVCRKECGANSGFGDLVYGSLRVVAAAEARTSPAVVTDAHSERPGTTGDIGPVWVAIALGAVLAVALGIVLMVRKTKPRASVR